MLRRTAIKAMACIPALVLAGKATETYLACWVGDRPISTTIGDPGVFVWTNSDGDRRWKNPKNWEPNAIPDLLHSCTYYDLTTPKPIS